VKLITRGDHFLFGSVFIKKSNRIEILKKKTETGSNRPVSVWFGFFRAKTGSNRFGSVLARFFSVWLGFFPGFFLFRFGSVFCLQNRTGRFFQNFNQFFFLVFSVIFFSGFLGLIGFLVFFSPLLITIIISLLL
jgi:hypothetical protein